eukprot:323259-Prorocentrum_minimum.AAC.2
MHSARFTLKFVFESSPAHRPHTRDQDLNRDRTLANARCPSIPPLQTPLRSPSDPPRTPPPAHIEAIRRLLGAVPLLPPDEVRAPSVTRGGDVIPVLSACSERGRRRTLRTLLTLQIFGCRLRPRRWVVARFDR